MGSQSMKKVLVAHATMAGSTVEVAQAVGEELVRSGLQVEVWPIGEVSGLRGYDAVVVGAPMILGWHRAARPGQWASGCSPAGWSTVD